MEASKSSETLVSCNIVTRHHNPEDHDMNLSDAFPIQIGLNEGNASSTMLTKFLSEYTITNAPGR